MNSFKKKYRIVGRKGEVYRLTAKELYERVQKDSLSDYNWITSATELIRVCNEEDFPREYAQGIKFAILNCFVNLESRQDSVSPNSSDAMAVYACYHSLDRDNEAVKALKAKYLKAIIRNVVTYHSSIFRLYHPGPTYKRLCEEWEKEKLEEYVLREEIYFNELRESLHADFKKRIQKAEEEGAFEEDEKKHSEEMREFWNSLDL